MKKENFKFRDSENHINDKYIFEDKECLILINEEIFNDETIIYANEILKKYKEEKDKILDYMLEKRLRDFYKMYSDEHIKENIGRPQIIIDSAKDKDHPNWKFKYAGIIEFCESKIDEHIISIEFIDDLNLNDDVQING